MSIFMFMQTQTFEAAHSYASPAVVCRGVFVISIRFPPTSNNEIQITDLVPSHLPQ